MTDAKDARALEREDVLEGLDDVGVPAGEGETWDELAERLREGDETRVAYVPPAVDCNHYDTAHDIVILDEELKDWPTVHQRIRDHELRHAEHGYGPTGIVKNLVQELRTDLFIRFSMSDDAKRVREYLDQRGVSPDDVSLIEEVSGILINILRSIWCVVLVPLGAVYRRVRSLGGESA
ncbi:hypothetical protein [Halorhabdus salina]|uniref:hypothetical protein n=1 Tax=Halorhabdus salina TaxID=2750670 RepID=UPI0015EE7AE8|nr:hypothetical protein [Halorhabdus salina]